MKLADLVTSLRLSNFTPALQSLLEREVSRGVASDLLSDVLARAPAGAVLVTVQGHLNAVAVASHTGLAAVILASGVTPEAAIVERACDEGVLLLGSDQPAFDVVGRLFALGLRGRGQ